MGHVTVAVVAGWTDVDVEAVNHVVRHGRSGHGVTQRLLDDLRRIVAADQVLVLEMDTDCVRLTDATPAGPGVDGWVGPLEHGPRPFGLPPGGVMAAALTSPSREGRLVFTRKDHEFDERDRALCELLAPHVASAYRRFAERRGGASALTPRQRMVLHLVARGHSNDEIAARLVVSPGTVRKHLDNIFRQLGVSSRAAAVTRAFPEGLPPSPAGLHRTHATPLPRQRAR